MKLRTKLIVAFVTVMLLPVLMSILLFFIAYRVELRTVTQTFGLTDASTFLSSDYIEAFSYMTDAMRESLEEIVEEDVSLLEDTEYLDSLKEEYEERNSFLIVRKDGEIIYTGNDEAADAIYSRLPNFSMDTTADTDGFYLGGEFQFLVSQMDFYFADGGEGSLFLVTDVSVLLPRVGGMLRELAVLVILVLLITALILVVWLYGSIIRPIGYLQKATREIRDGNLDFVLEVDGNDEISDLCRDFEQMRRRLKENAEEKMQYDSESKVLISNISHDLKTPITAIKGYVEGILDGVANTPEKLDKYVRTIYNKANDMDRLIDELTIYSKIDTNRIPYEFAQIDVEEYFSSYAEEMRMDLESKNIELTYYNYLTEDVRIIADAEQLKRVMNNIISNSVKYLDKKRGIINLRIRDAGDFIQVEIEDNGRGIARKDLPYIFDRFFRADASRNSSTGGSGIGLSIVKKIIEDHGGRIWATSKEGTGTIMHFVLRKGMEEIR